MSIVVVYLLIMQFVKEWALAICWFGFMAVILVLVAVGLYESNSAK